MKTLSTENFGLLIAYLLPGFVTLWGIAYFSTTVRTWITVDPWSAPTVGGFLYGTLGSTAAGLIVSTVRWFLVDRLLHRTGIPEPSWDFARISSRFDAFEGLVHNHYRYYQFNANMLVALVLAYGAHLVAFRQWPGQGGLADIGVLFVGVVLFLGSRDTMRKYYARARDILEGRIG